MHVHLVDGTYELFRHYFALPASKNPDGVEIAAARGVVRSMLSLLEEGATHVGVATDHVVESFRNDLWPGYKRGEGIEPALLAQFPILEDALTALGLKVWPMEEFEADDALASAAAQAAAYAERVFICTPDKDLAQSVVDDKVVQFDRRAGVMRGADAIIEKFGVPPSSIPDYLALVGDSSDGFPGLPGWGAKTAAMVLSKYGHLEDIPDDADAWDVQVRGAAKLAETLVAQRDLALLFKDLAMLRASLPIDASEEALRWTGPTDNFEAAARALGAPSLVERAAVIARNR